jgi:hypothetical protein
MSTMPRHSYNVPLPNLNIIVFYIGLMWSAGRKRLYSSGLIFHSLCLGAGLIKRVNCHVIVCDSTLATHFIQVLFYSITNNSMQWSTCRETDSGSSGREFLSIFRKLESFCLWWHHPSTIPAKWNEPRVFHSISITWSSLLHSCLCPTISFGNFSFSFHAKVNLYISYRIRPVYPPEFHHSFPDRLNYEAFHMYLIHYISYFPLRSAVHVRGIQQIVKLVYPVCTAH